MGKWKRKISGLTLSNERGKAIFTRLSIFSKALRNTEAEHLLPRPIGYLPQIRFLKKHYHILPVGTNKKISPHDLQKLAKALEALSEIQKPV